MDEKSRPPFYRDFLIPALTPIAIILGGVAVVVLIIVLIMIGILLLD
jgi:hypothetical protein